MVLKRSFKVKKAVNGAGLARYFHPWTRDDGKTENWKEGDYVIGVYVDSITDKFKHECPVLQVLDAQLSYPVIDKNGDEVDIVDKNLQLNHCGSLAYAFFGENEKGKEPIDKGQIVQVTYLEKGILEKGPYAGKASHSVLVEIMEQEQVEGPQDDDVY